jgi:hypothetical protein
MASFYANENFPLRVVQALRLLGHDVLTSLEAGNANRGIPDEDVLLFSSSQNRVLLTLNRRDFIRLHNISQRHAGIVVCTQDENIQQQADCIHNAIAEISNLSGQLIRINRPAR